MILSSTPRPRAMRPWPSFCCRWLPRETCGRPRSRCSLRRNLTRSSRRSCKPERAGSDRMAEVSPDLFFDAALAYQKTAAIKAALALDLFTAISQRSGDLDQVAAQTGASARGARILCDHLTVQGILQEELVRFPL